ncbi:MAG: DegT/DnrJ/EryC1/StrS family aminotransferase [Blastochloris sp.]|nr:DegT/DnrJ/EryC1/StrS family aminotransferase [Blastochloris sp.]
MQTTAHTEPIPFVDLKAQHAPISAEISEAVHRVIQKTNFILGDEVSLFEEEFAAYCENTYAVGVDSGTAALELAIRAHGLGPGDEIITTANTFIATVFAISHTGATPVLVDVDAQTYTMDVAALERAITPRTKAIVPVQLYGQPADMDAIMELARQHHLIVMEDAAQAHGARYKGKRVGSLAHTSAFSFYPAKNLGCCGDGGAVVTSDAQVANTIKVLRNCGQSEKNYHPLIGHNHRLDTMQAAILRIKLKHIDAWNAGRRQAARRYYELLAGHPGIVAPEEAAYAESVWHLYVVRVEEREALQKYLSEQGISTGIHYPVPIHVQEAYKSLGYPEGSFPITEQYAPQIVSLPMFAELTDEAIQYVVEHILAFVEQRAVTSR